MEEIKGFNFNSILKDWDFIYNQTSVGHLECKVQQVSFDNFLLYKEQINTSTFQVGGCQNESLNLGFFSNSAVYMGKEVHEYEIISLSPHDEILLKTPENSIFYSLSVPLNSFSDEIAHFPLISDVINIQQDSSFRLAINRIFYYLFNSNFNLKDEKQLKEIKKDIIDMGYQYFYNFSKKRLESSLTRENQLKL